MASITICTVTGTVQNLLGSVVQNCQITVSVVSPFVHPTNGSWISGQLASVETDASGGFSIAVIETETPGIRLRFTFNYYDGIANRIQKTYAVVVPDAATALLTDLISASTTSITNPTFPASSVTVNPIVDGANNAQDAFENIEADVVAINVELANKLDAALGDTHIFVGNGSGIAQDRAVTGDISITDTGATTVAKIQTVSVAGVTGTGNIVFSAAPTLTGQISGDTAQFGTSSTRGVVSLVGPNGTPPRFVLDNTNTSGGKKWFFASGVPTAGKVSITNDTDTILALTFSAAGALQLPIYTTAGVLINDTSGNVTTSATVPKLYGGTNQDNSSLTFPSTGTVQAISPNNHGVLISGAGATATVIAPDASASKLLKSGGSSADPSWLAYTDASTASTIMARDASANVAANIVTSVFKSSTANAAATGALRLANGDAIEFRNAANSADIAFGTGSSNTFASYAGVDLVNVSSAQTLTNKTLTTPIISSISNTGTLTLPTNTGTVSIQSALWDGFHKTDSSWSRSNASYGDPAADTSSTFTELCNRGMGTVSSYNDGTGGHNLPGIVFTPPRTGYYRITATFPCFNGTTNGQMYFKLWDGTTNICENQIQVDTASQQKPMILMGIWNCTSAVSSTISIQFGSTAATAVTIGGTTTPVQLLHWTVEEIN